MTYIARRQLCDIGATVALMLRDVRARVLIADDHQCFLDRVVALLEPEFTVVGAVTSGRQLVAAAEALQPTVLVIDVSMPDMTGLEALDAIRARGLCTPAVFLTAWQEPEIVAAAWNAGALGFVVKTAVARDLVPALRTALQGQRFLSSSVVQSVPHSA
jgi:DNA-binding NarL/FixJ family response regulator